MLKSKQVLTGAFLSLFLFVMTVSIAAADFPVTVVDDLGTKITMDAKPMKIISLAPSNTEMLYALGLDEEIVGVTSFADYPAEAVNKEKIGTITEPNIEKIVAMQPDLVIAVRINPLESIKRLKELGIKVASFDPQTVDDIFTTFKDIGQLTGQNEEARKLVTDLYIKIASIQDLVDGILKEKSRPKVFYEIWHDPLYTAGKNTFIDDVITLAGGTNIGRKAPGAWPQYSLESLLIENPDVYVASPHSDVTQVSVADVLARKNFKNLKAIKNKRVYIIDQNIISRPSPRIVDGLKKFVKAIFPELSSQIDQL